MRRFLFWLSAGLPLRVISDAGRPYLERYFLAQLLGFNVYLHRFVASDPDRGLHDHPWAWAFSIVLAGRYLEETRTARMPLARSVRWFNFLTGDSFHRVIIAEGADVWTLFVHRTRKVKPWGFLRPSGDARIAYYSHYTSAADDWWVEAPRGRDEPRRQPA